jgi:DNA-binding transcriptional ArsR family regulator
VIGDGVASVPARSGRLGRRGRGDTALDRMLHALNHPVRRRALRLLSYQDGSASTLSKAMGIELGIVSYHLNQVLGKECEIVELVDTVPRRGALEKFYRLRADALSGVAADSGAAEDGWEWFLALVDDAAWEEIRRAREEFDARVRTAVEGSRARGQERGEAGEVQTVVVGVAAFSALDGEGSTER